MTKSRRFTLSVSNQNKEYNLAHFERGRDGSSYITPSLENKIGMHLSFHSSGITQIATTNPPASARFMRQGFVEDIMNKRTAFFKNNTPFKPKDSGGMMMILRMDDLFNKLRYVAAVTNRKINIDLQAIIKSTDMVTTDSMTYACNYLQQKNFIKDTDFVIMGDLSGDITFFTPPLSNPTAVIINPSNLNSLMQLPGIEPIMPPIKELTEKISGASYNRSDDNTELDISNLSPRMNLQLKSPR